MTGTAIVQAIVTLCTIFLFHGGTFIAQANNIQSKESSSHELNLNSNSIGGMSRLLDDYYAKVLSKTGISISNVATTIYVNGERLTAKDNSSLLFRNMGFVNVNGYINVRSDASIDSTVVGKLFRAGAAKIESIDGDWMKITSNKVSGYVSKQYIYSGNKGITLAKEVYKPYAKVTCNSLNIRTGPGEHYKIITNVNHGEQFEIVNVLEDWVQIKYTENFTGYISKDYVDFIYPFEYAKTIDETKTDINCMVWPLPSDHKIHCYYGYRVAPIQGASTFHEGLDIGGPMGAEIVAVLSGKVCRVSHSSSRGNFVEINHGNGNLTRYLHCSKILVSEGEYVNQGEAIALVGSSGISTGPHLHFSLIRDGKNIDPYPYLKPVH